VSLPEADLEIRNSIVRHNPFAHSCILIRKEVYEKVGGYDPGIVYGQDYDLWFRVIRLVKVANLPDILCRRSVNSGSISHQKQNEQMRQCLRTQWKYMSRRNPLNYLYMVEPFLLAYLTVDFKNRLRALIR